MILKTKRYSPYFGYPVLTAIISLLVIIFVFGFFAFYLLIPRSPLKRLIRGKSVPEAPKQIIAEPLVQVFSLPEPRVEERIIINYNIDSSITQFVERICVPLSLYKTTDSTIGTGFLVQDTFDPTCLFMVTALHVFFDSEENYSGPIFLPKDQRLLARDTIYLQDDTLFTVPQVRLRDPIFFFIHGHKNESDSAIIEKIRVREALRSGRLMFHSDYTNGIDLAIYHFKAPSEVEVSFLRDYMLFTSTPLKMTTKIYSCGCGEWSPKDNNLFQFICCNGEIIFIDNKYRIYRISKYTISLPKGLAILKMDDEIYLGASGSPVIVNGGNMWRKEEIRLAGILCSNIGVEIKLKGKFVTSMKLQELIDKFNFLKRGIKKR